MVHYPERRILPPYLAKVQPPRPRLTFSRLPGSFVSKHTNGRPVSVTRVKGFFNFEALIFKTPLNEDLDGAPNSFAPPISATNLNPVNGLQPIETSLKNATNQKDPDPVFHDNNALNTFEWTGVMSRPLGTPGVTLDDRPFLRDSRHRFPVLQPAGSPFAGFYEPQTAMAMPDGRAVNPLEIPYAALGASLRNEGHVGLGDFGLSFRVSTGASSGFIYADAGGRSSTAVGECSRKMIRNLFGGPATGEDIAYLVFPGTAVSRAARPDLIPARLERLLNDLALFENVDELVDQLANPQFGEPLLAGRRFVPAGIRMRNVEALIAAEPDAASRTVMAQLRRWGFRG